MTYSGKRGQPMPAAEREKRSKGQRWAAARRRRESDLLAPVVIRDAERGVIRPEAEAAHAIAQAETLAIAEALGLHEDAVTPQRAALLRRFSRIACVELLVFRRVCQAEGDDVAALGSRLATLTREARSLLGDLGLELYRRELDLSKGVEVQFESDPAPASSSRRGRVRGDAAASGGGGVRSGASPAPGSGAAVSTSITKADS